MHPVPPRLSVRFYDWLAPPFRGDGLVDAVPQGILAIPYQDLEPDPLAIELRLAEVLLGPLAARVPADVPPPPDPHSADAAWPCRPSAGLLFPAPIASTASGPPGSPAAPALRADPDPPPVVAGPCERRPHTARSSGCASHPVHPAGVPRPPARAHPPAERRASNRLCPDQHAKAEPYYCRTTRLTPLLATTTLG